MKSDHWYVILTFNQIRLIFYASTRIMRDSEETFSPIFRLNFHCLFEPFPLLWEYFLQEWLPLQIQNFKALKLRLFDPPLTWSPSTLVSEVPLFLSSFSLQYFTICLRLWTITLLPSILIQRVILLHPQKGEWSLTRISSLMYVGILKQKSSFWVMIDKWKGRLEDLFQTRFLIGIPQRTSLKRSWIKVKTLSRIWCLILSWLR